MHEPPVLRRRNGDIRAPGEADHADTKLLRHPVDESCAARCAATNLDGRMSCELIESDESIAMSTVASSRWTLTLACGRATPTIIAASATRKSASGRCLRQPGVASTRFGSSPGVGEPAA